MAFRLRLPTPTTGPTSTQLKPFLIYLWLDTPERRTAGYTFSLRSQAIKQPTKRVKVRFRELPHHVRSHGGINATAKFIRSEIDLVAVGQHGRQTSVTFCRQISGSAGTRHTDNLIFHLGIPCNNEIPNPAIDCLHC